MSSDITLKPNFKTDNVDFEDYIEEFQIDFKTPKGSFIGSFNSWNISMSLNKSNIDIPEKIKLEIAINEKYQAFPSFILTPVRDEETEEIFEIKGYDKSILFDEDFEWTETLPTTAGKLAQGICNKLGVEIENIDFINSDFIIYRQLVDNKKTYREVIAMIAAIAAGNAFINGNDKLEIRSFIDSDIELQEYFSSDKFVKVGPITGINIAREPIKDYKIKDDEELIAEYKKCTLKITNNLIVDDNRELAIDAIYNQLRGLEFYCKKIETHEAYLIKPFSFVNLNGNKILVDTISVMYPTLVDSYISSNELTEVESSLNTPKGIRKRLINAEAKVDEVEGNVKLLAEELNSTEESLAQLELETDSISQKVNKVVDITQEKSDSQKIILEDCMAGELLELHIYGNNTVFENGSLIKITRQTFDSQGQIETEENEEIDLGIKEVLKQKDDACDEYVLENNKAKVIRNIGVLEDGTTYIRETPEIEELGDLIIIAPRGTLIIEILDYIANISAKWVIVNDFTSLFSSTVEMKNTVEQMANSLKIDISKKVGINEIFARMNMYIQGKGDQTEMPDDIEKSVIEFISNSFSWEADHSSMTKEGILTLRNKSTEPYVYTLNDALNVLNYIKGNLSLSNELLELYDANNDGTINILDAVLMLNIINGSKESEKYADSEIVFNPLSPSEFIKMTLGDAIQCRIGLNEIYNYTYRGMNLFLGVFADMDNQYGVSVNGEKGIITVTSEEASTNTVIDAGMVDAYNVKASSGGGKGFCLHGIDESHSYRCHWNSYYGTYFFEVYVDDAEIPLIKSVTTDAQQISQMRLQTSYIEFIVPRYGAYSISGIAQSDTKLKENIKDTKVKALDIINKIKHIEFDWKKTNQALRQGHEVIAHSANQINEDIGNDIAYSVEQPEGAEYDSLLQLDYNRLMPYVTKSLQELSTICNEQQETIDKQQKIINFLAEKLGYSEEISKL